MTAPSRAQLEFLQSIDTPTVCNLVEIVAPERRGFGTRFVERGLAREFDGEVQLEFAPGGVRCQMRIPLSAKLRMAA